MNIEEIISRREILNKELRTALASMEQKETIFKIKKQLNELQTECPHFSEKFNWVIADGICPYCGKKL